jgi:hypothetical protein
MARRLCACGCDKKVGRKTEIAHLNGKGRAALLSSVLAQNGFSQTADQPTSKRRKRAAGIVGKQRILGRSVPRHHQAPSPGPSHRQDPLEYTPLRDGHPPSPPTSDLGIPSCEERAPSQLQDADCVVERIARVAKHRWELNHIPRFGVGRDDSDDDDSESGEEQTALEMDTEEDDGADDDGEDTGLESGQRGILVLDGLDEDFLAEVSNLGLLTLPFFSMIF